jgi:hypothetical protein
MRSAASSSANDRRTIASLVVMALGLAVTFAAVAWMAVVKPSTVWTPAEAAEYQRAGEALHAARRGAMTATSARGASANQGGGDNVPPESPELTAAQQRFNRINADLERARDRHNRWGRWAAGAG